MNSPYSTILTALISIMNVNFDKVENKEKIYCVMFMMDVWKDFQSLDNNPFFSEEGNLALMMNMDFFSPISVSSTQ